MTQPPREKRSLRWPVRSLVASVVVHLPWADNYDVWWGVSDPISGDSAFDFCGEQHACGLPTPVPVLGPRCGAVAAHMEEEGLAKSREVPAIAGANASGGGDNVRRGATTLWSSP